MPILHLDADCFFASCELKRAPHLRGKKMAVCSRTDNRGIVLAATYEARPLGIKAGTPVFQAKKLCPSLILLPSCFEDYELTSIRMMQILKKFSPDTEECSIDEAYADITGLRLLYRTDYAGIGRLIQSAVHKELGITVSIGIAQTKLLAKMASDFQKPAGLTMVTKLTRETFLKKLPLGAIPGVGPNTEAFLQKCGLTSAWNVAHTPLDRIKNLLGKRGEELWNELNGQSVWKIKTIQSLPKSLLRSRTFPNFLTEESKILAACLELVTNLSRRLRAYGLETSLMGFFLITKDFQTFGQKNRLEHPTDSDQVFIQIFQNVFSKIFHKGPVYRKAGFFFTDLQKKGPLQPTLFENPKRGEIDPVLDRIYRKFGPAGIRRGSLLM